MFNRLFKFVLIFMNSIRRIIILIKQKQLIVNHIYGNYALLLLITETAVCVSRPYNLSHSLIPPILFVISKVEIVLYYDDLLTIFKKTG